MIIDFCLMQMVSITVKGNHVRRAKFGNGGGENKWTFRLMKF